METNVPALFDSSVPFETCAMQVYQTVLETLPVYRSFASSFPDPDGDINAIPLIPVQAFQDFDLIGSGLQAETVFQSSGTAGDRRSRHPVADLSLAREAVMIGFQRYFSLDNTTILCYAPGYADNPQSSLLWMMQQLIDRTAKHGSRFLPLGEPLQREEWARLDGQGRRIILFGAAFGLLDLAEMDSFALPPNTTIIETGGMKTYRREMGREALHETLATVFRLDRTQIWSEYGMCEMTSQCYAPGVRSGVDEVDGGAKPDARGRVEGGSKGAKPDAMERVVGIDGSAEEDCGFRSPHWVRISIRDPLNPMRICETGEEGKIGIMDLANVHSCPFFLTEDKGVSLETVDGEAVRFQVLGRWKQTMLRGCNFLIDTE